MFDKKIKITDVNDMMADLPDDIVIKKSFFNGKYNGWTFTIGGEKTARFALDAGNEKKEFIECLKQVKF